MFEVAVLLSCMLLTAVVSSGVRHPIRAAVISGAFISCALMYVTLRASINVLFGSRPTAVLMLSLCAFGIAWAVGRGGLTQRAAATAGLGLVVFLVSFRSQTSGDVAISAWTLALPSMLLGAASGKAGALGLRRMTILLGGLLGALILAEGAALQGRLALPSENPIWIGRELAFAAIAVLASGGPLARRLLFALPFVAGVYLTGSRGPLLALVVGALVLASRAYVGRTRVLLPIAGLLLAAAAVSGGLVDAVTFGIDRTDSVTTRVSLWREVLQQWLAHPLLGSGTANDRTTLSGFSSPHNFVLELLAQGGLVALAAFLLMLVIAWRRSAEHSATGQALLAATIIMSLFSGSIWVNLELWLLIAWCSVLMQASTSSDGRGPIAGVTSSSVRIRPKPAAAGVGTRAVPSSRIRIPAAGVSAPRGSERAIRA